jgi:hypothetical protein
MCRGKIIGIGLITMIYIAINSERNHEPIPHFLSFRDLRSVSFTLILFWNILYASEYAEWIHGCLSREVSE